MSKKREETRRVIELYRRHLLRGSNGRIQVRSETTQEKQIARRAREDWHKGEHKGVIQALVRQDGFYGYEYECTVCIPIDSYLPVELPSDGYESKGRPTKAAQLSFADIC